MDPSDGKGSLNLMVEAVALNPAADSSNAQKDTPPTDMLRMNQQMSNQCFEMAVQLQAGKSKRSCSTSEAERDLPVYVKELEGVKTLNFNSTLTLHRMQMWHAIGETVKGNYSGALKAGNDRCMALCSQIKQCQQESKDLQDEVTEVLKKRLEMKRLIDEKMKEMEDLKSKKEDGFTEKYKAAMEKGQENLEKYRKLGVMTQNVLRGIILACRVNWMEDPTLRDIAMTLEDLPFSD
ncbi:centromere protein H isoform X2 [Gymnodraco acuticeps]|uniref:Centromere protein H isoform X2 n=1 Tax=Gymnodraco acuticeps TaxID=8218 RepID=A0A6P8T2F0_GYMAC|nr:centromere protein H isoform X2 [Gymnodraco acuticeps]